MSCHTGKEELQNPKEKLQEAEKTCPNKKTDHAT